MQLSIFRILFLCIIEKIPVYVCIALMSVYVILNICVHATQI